jgi:hypothetical protein
MSSLWLSIEPTPNETRLLLSCANFGVVMKARLQPIPAQPQALAQLLEALVAWYGAPLCAVLDADAEDVRRHPDRWAEFFGALSSPHISISWGMPSIKSERDRFLGTLGRFERGKRLINFAATGQP